MDDDNVAEGYRAGMASAATQGDFVNGYSAASAGSSHANETTASNNVNGPGSGSVRVYQYTV